MRILMVVGTYKPAYVYGGPVVCISLLAEALARRGHTVTVYTTTANGEVELEVETGREILVDGVRVFYFKRITKDHTHVSPALWQHLNRTIKDFDVVHLHSWWNFLILGAAWICKRHGIKPILTPHGMFSDYVLRARNSRKKSVLHWLFGRELLKNSIIHATSETEFEEAKRLIPEAPCEIIHNLVQLPQKKYERDGRRFDGVLKIGFLSRIHDKKGLDILIETLSEIDFPWRLSIAGDGEDGYLRSLKELAARRGVADKIEWVGWKNGGEKFEFLTQLDLFALTSLSENFALVVIESLSVGTPVLISDQVGLHDYVRENDLGWVCDLNPNNIAARLNDIFHNSQKRLEINEFAAAKIVHDFEETRLTAEYLNLYAANKQ